MKRFFTLCLFALLACVLSADVARAISAKENSAILATVRANSRAVQRENLTAMMQTIHPQSPGYASTKSTMQQLFKLYDLRYVFRSNRVIGIAGDTALVSFDQSTYKVRGPNFTNNRIIGVHIVKKYKGAWKMYSTRVDKIQRLK